MLKKVLVLGLGVSGKSAARFLLEKGDKVFAFDQNVKIKEQEEIQELFLKGLQFLDESIAFEEYQFDLVVVSPGINPSEKYYALAKALHIEIIGETHLALQFIKNPMIAVTGTNGKTTVTLLIEHVLNHSGVKALPIGNIGKPLTSYLLEPKDEAKVLVVELSSYQLETLNLKCFDAGVILNITPDHLDRYKTFLDYALQKIKLKECLKEKKTLYANERVKKEFDLTNVKQFGYSKSSNLYTDLENVYLNQKFSYTLPKTLQGQMSHEIENMMAAYAMVKEFNVTENQFLEAWATFKKPKHRIEFVKTVKGVNYYDDSKGTNIDAVLRAVHSLKGPIYLIAGGVDKGSSYQPWKSFKGKVKRVFTIGQAAYKIKEELQSSIDVEVFETLELAVNQAYSESVKGDSVLLSPGCSSFDMFKDYKERGAAFQKIVHFLED